MAVARGKNQSHAASRLPLDLTPFSDSHDLSVTLNRAEHPSDATIRRGKDITLFIVAVAFIVAVGGYCLYVVWARAGSVDDIKWSTSILTAIIGGLVGYLTGRTHR